MYEAPTMFWTIWQLVSPFIDPETKQKVVFVSSKSAIAEFQKAIGPSVSPCGRCLSHHAPDVCVCVGRQAQQSFFFLRLYKFCCKETSLVVYHVNACSTDCVHVLPHC